MDYLNHSENFWNEYWKFFTHLLSNVIYIRQIYVFFSWPVIYCLQYFVRGTTIKKSAQDLVTDPSKVSHCFNKFQSTPHFLIKSFNDYKSKEWTSECTHTLWYRMCYSEFRQIIFSPFLCFYRINQTLCTLFSLSKCLYLHHLFNVFPIISTNELMLNFQITFFYFYLLL